MESSKCQVCGAQVERSVRAKLCPACETPLHPECWEYNGGCATYACREAPGTKNGRGRQQPQLYIADEPVRRRHPDRPPHHQPPPAPSTLAALLALLGRAAGFCFGLTFLMIFVAGFLDSLGGGPRGSRTHRRFHRTSRAVERAVLLRSSDSVAHMRELTAIANEKRCTPEEMRLICSLAVWTPDPVKRAAALKAALAVTGHDRALQEMLASVMAGRDAALNAAARERLPGLGPLSPYSIECLVALLGGAPGPAAEAMALLERLSADPQLVRLHTANFRIPAAMRARVDRLIAGAR